MTHSLPIAVSPETYGKFDACIHCGLCLPACPTYLLTTDEADSPRGRILLMKAAVDQRIEPNEKLFEHLDRCLVCRACEPACPGGVQFHDLIEAIRPQVATAVLGSNKRLANPLLQWIISHLFPFPTRVALSILPLRLLRAVGLGGLIQKLSSLMPAPLGDMAAMLPDAPLFGNAVPDFTPADAPRRGSVLFLQGCVGSVVSRDLNRACIRVLARNGFDVHVLRAEPCCGAMAAHANDPTAAGDFAQQLVDVLATRQEDYFVSAIAGCGAQLKSLNHVLHDAPRYADRAAAVTKKMRDITELLAATGLRPPARRIERTVTYHDPCHLLNAQRLSDPPRKLLAQIPGLKIVSLVESDLCCGAAGTYNLSQPELSAQLGDRKAGHILETAATECITANIGCQMQIEKSLRRTAPDRPIPIRHVIEILAEAYGE